MPYSMPQLISRSSQHLQTKNCRGLAPGLSRGRGRLDANWPGCSAGCSSRFFAKARPPHLGAGEKHSSTGKHGMIKHICDDLYTSSCHSILMKPIFNRNCGSFTRPGFGIRLCQIGTGRPQIREGGAGRRCGHGGGCGHGVPVV